VARRRSGALGLAAALAALGVWAAPAQATFHLILVREVYPGSIANPDSQYVELQMYAAGQNFVGGHVLRTYAAGGGATKLTLPADVPGGANQSTILIATPQAEAQFGVTADAELQPLLDPVGGAVCWESLDCVAWGSFAGTAAGATGTPAPAIPDGMALRRKITSGCATLLEPGDDHDDSATDFEAVFPAPRPNSVAPTEHACGGGGGGGPAGGSSAPQTILRRRPAKRTADRTPTFRFRSEPPGAAFECRLDRGRFRPCRSPFTSRRLGLGRHTFRVRAVLGAGGLVDRSPARFSFRVVRRHAHRRGHRRHGGHRGGR
jgi:hypothetical protein